MQEENYRPIKYAVRYIYGHLENPPNLNGDFFFKMMARC